MGKKNGSGAVRVLVVAAASVRRAGLEAIVKDAEGFRLVGAVASLMSLTGQVRELQPDILLADLDRADHSLLAALASEDGPAPASVVLIDAPDLAWSVRALRSGVKAILTRDASSAEILAAIEAAHGGFVTLAPDVAEEFARHVHADEAEPAPEMVQDLTPRELEVLRMLGRGFSNKEMAVRLGISDHTVKFHISSILAKLDVSSRTEAVTQGIRMGVIVI
jgi:two-component system, NarL family, response regulator YdfI